MSVTVSFCTHKHTHTYTQKGERTEREEERKKGGEEIERERERNRERLSGVSSCKDINLQVRAPLQSLSHRVLGHQHVNLMRGHIQNIAGLNSGSQNICFHPHFNQCDHIWSIIPSQCGFIN
jgi:hypothetical protein